jgi:site-specific DNA recombinase
MSPTYSIKGSKHYGYYICSNAQKRGWDHCPSQSVPADQMERTVLEQISKVGKDPERLQKILTEASKQRHVRLTALESERRRLERELQILTENLLQKTGASDDGKQSVSGFETIQENIGHVERRLAETQELRQALQQTELQLEPAAQAFMALEQGFDELPVIEQARLIRLMVQRVDYDGAQSKLALTLDPAGLVEVLKEQNQRKKNSK